MSADMTLPVAGGGHNTTSDERLSAILNSDEKFTIAAYLNAALEDDFDNNNDEGGSSSSTRQYRSPHEREEDLQQRMAELALQLQLQTQACHEDIGRIGAELQAILPRCAADVSRVGVGLDGLRIDAGALLESCAGTESSEEQQVSSSLETLSTLHALQANLSRTKEILTAAATWDSTLAEVAPLLAAQNLTEAVNCLQRLENGERALRGMPHPEERLAALKRIRQQVSVLLQPQLKHALANMNTRLAPLQQCVQLYSKLGNMDALKDEYVKNRPAPIHKAWFDYTPSYRTATTETGAGPDDDMAASAFLTWLTGWFDAVLSLVTEERRQSMAVFGADLVPEITIKVFRECFRPILPSFQSRLESIYSSNTTRQQPGGTSSNNNKGTLESVCTIYESTLQFLSLSYESIAGGWLDMVEGGMISQAGGLELFHELAAICLQVTSPFANYQERLAGLEAKHSGVAMQSLKLDIRAAAELVSGYGFALETLQESTERLQGLSSSAFSVAEGAVARFELMNAGYGATRALSTIDQIMASHASELAIAISRLSASTDERQMAENFDEPHVLCALEVLKVAGTYNQGMKSIEQQTRGRLSVLCERMAAHTAQEKELEEVAMKRRAGSSPSKTSSFLLPDSLSAVEIDCIVTKAVCGSQEEDPNTSCQVLQKLANTSSDTHTGVIAPLPLYPETEEAAKRLAQSCHAYIFDVCSSVPRHHLGSMSSMPSWKEEASDGDFAAYGTLPQTYVTAVGEHMLALVQALEPFASDPDNLAVANLVMSGLRDIAKQAWRDFVSASGSMDSDSIIDIFMDGKGIAEYVLGDAILDEEDEDIEGEDEEDEAAKASAAFCNAWLDVVGLAVTGRLLERIMRIPSLTPKGCEHLNADLNYLVNVFSALGVSGHPHPFLSHVAALSTLDGDLMAERIASRNRHNPIEASLRSIEERLAAMKGMAASYNY